MSASAQPRWKRVVVKLSGEALQGSQTHGLDAKTIERIPEGRWGSPADIGGAAVFLASRAADYVQGHILAVDGGWLAR